jgi:C-terminal processing protease CtpA/Prc
LFAIPLASRIDQPFERDRSGLRVVREGNRLNVTYVAENSPAAAAGWTKGDTIVAINGEPVGPNTVLGPAGGLISAPAGTTVTLTMANGSTRKLTLADYF